MKIYEPAAQIIEHALLDYDENPEKFIPNSHPTIEDNINNIPPDLDINEDKYSFLIPNEDTYDTTYDLQQDFKVQKHNYIDSVQ